MENRLYRADCKLVADQLKHEGVKVDLIYLDPPFNSDRTYSMIFNHGSVTAQQVAYHDMWDFTDSTRQLVLAFGNEMNTWNLPESFKAFMRAWLRILEGGSADDRKLLNYLMYMTQRLIRLRDILKPTGSIYFHCDPTASHYIKMIMDGVFGRSNFRNEIVWRRTKKKGNIQLRYARNHDIILFYAASKQARLKPFKPYDMDSLGEKTLEQYDKLDAEGRRYQLTDLTNPNRNRPNLTYEFLGVTRVWRWTKERMEQAHTEGKIVQSRPGAVPRLKRYLDEQRGMPQDDLWGRHSRTIRRGAAWI